MSTPQGGNSAAIDKLTAAIEKAAAAAATQAAPIVTPTPPAPTPVITQTSAQGIATEVDNARAAVDKASNERRDAIVKQLEERIATFETEQKELKARQSWQRRSSLSLGEATELLGDSAGLVKAETKHLFGRLGAERAAKSNRFVQRFGERSPIDILVRGAFIAPDASGIGLPTLFTAGSDDEVLREVQVLNDQILVWTITQSAKGRSNYQPHDAPMWADYERAVGQLCKALDTTDTANLVPTSFSSTMLERYQLERVLVPALETQQIPRSPFQMPVMGAYTTTYLLAEATSDPENTTFNVPSSDFATTKITYTLKSIGARTSWSYELEQDAVPAVAAEAVKQLGQSMAFCEEQALIDGDTTATHQDSDVTTSTNIRKAWNGLRKIAILRSFTSDMSTLTGDTLVGMIRAMGKFGVRNSELFFVVSPKTRAILLVLKDANNNPLMVGLTNQFPVTTTAMVPSLFGIPVLTVEAMRENLNASGVYDGTITTKTGILLVNKTGFRYAWISEAVTVESQRWIRTRQVEVVASTRRDFEETYPTSTSTNHTVHYGINVATS